MKSPNTVLVFVVLTSLQCFPVSAASLQLFCGSFNKYISTEMENPLPLLNSSCYNNSRPSVMYAFGFNGTANDQHTMMLIDAYLSFNKYNIFLINWKQEVTAPKELLLKLILYTINAVPNTIKIGKQCGEALIKMTRANFSLSNFHLIGHSLGAHLAGYCGKTVQKYGKNISRITGLDPAGPLFDGIISLDGLDPSCASFVDVHHTNPGQFGTNENLGVIDIWYNFINGNQPGCRTDSINILSVLKDTVVCSHFRALKYYAEALRNESSFEALMSDSYATWEKQKSTVNSESIYIAEKINTGASGNFFLSTNAASPYGKGKAGLLPPS